MSKRQCLYECIVNVRRNHENLELTSESNDRPDLKPEHSLQRHSGALLGLCLSSKLIALISLFRLAASRKRHPATSYSSSKPSDYR